MEQSREKQKVTEETKTMNVKEKETNAEKERNEQGRCEREREVGRKP